MPVDGNTIYARLYSFVGGAWVFNDFVYEAAGGPSSKTQMATPASGTKLSSGTVPFTWNAGSGAAAYWLYVGNSLGAGDLYDSGSLANGVLAKTVAGLPTDGRRMYVRLYSLLGGAWFYNDYFYTASGP